jgi:hypothetical protein
LDNGSWHWFGVRCHLSVVSDQLAVVMRRCDPPERGAHFYGFFCELIFGRRLMAATYGICPRAQALMLSDLSGVEAPLMTPMARMAGV